MLDTKNTCIYLVSAILGFGSFDKKREPLEVKVRLGLLLSHSGGFNFMEQDRSSFVWFSRNPYVARGTEALKKSLQRSFEWVLRVQ